MNYFCGAALLGCSRASARPGRHAGRMAGRKPGGKAEAMPHTDHSKLGALQLLQERFCLAEPLEPFLFFFKRLGVDASPHAAMLGRMTQV